MSPARLCRCSGIRPDGTKRCWTSAPLTGAAYRLGHVQPGGTVYVAEGAATGATVHAETGDPVACAMFAGNLLAVARGLRARHPGVRLVLAGD